MPDQDTITPYSGPVKETPENLSVAFPTIQRAVEKGKNVLDQESQQNLDELRAQMRSTPPKPATIVNLHPWPLSLSHIRLCRGITVPACPPGQEMAWTHVRTWRTDWKYNENAALVFSAIHPIKLAGEFVREFSDKDNDGGGVLIYEGDSSPAKVTQVETYNPMGRPEVIEQMGFEYDEEGNKIPVPILKPIFGNFTELVKAARKMRNDIYFRKVQNADHDYRLPDGRGRKSITDKHRLMAEVLHAEGVIPVVPEWNLAGRMEAGLSEHDCPSCQTPTKEGAFLCANCKHILKPLEAYRNGAIEFGHMSFELLSTDEMEEAEQIRQERATRKTEFQKKHKVKGSKEQE